MKLYVEGGGDAASLKVECRKGFNNFITKAGIKNRPRIVACGNRKNAYDSYCTAIKNGEQAFLLVDSEESIEAKYQSGGQNDWKPWGHLKARRGDGWEKPIGANDTDCHLMVQVMETWFVADKKVLKKFFGSNLNENKLPANVESIETVSKKQLFAALSDATKMCTPKGAYGKGAHSFKILYYISPNLVCKASPWADRFIKQLKNAMDQ